MSENTFTFKLNISSNNEEVEKVYKLKIDGCKVLDIQDVKIISVSSDIVDLDIIGDFGPTNNSKISRISNKRTIKSNNYYEDDDYVYDETIDNFDIFATLTLSSYFDITNLEMNVDYVEAHQFYLENNPITDDMGFDENELNELFKSSEFKITVEELQ